MAAKVKYNQIITITGRGLWLLWELPMKKSQRQWEFPSGRSSAGARITKVSVAHWPREREFRCEGNQSLYQRAVGYEYEEEKKIIEYDKDGNVKPIKIEKTKSKFRRM